MREVKPTQKPVPSSDVKDLFFNSGKIDEWVNSLQHEYTDRFGKCHKTAAGMEWVFNQLVERFKIESEQALLAAGYAPAGTFQEGAEVVSRNGTVLWKLPDGDGEHYRWDGGLPKQVPAGSTPQSTGGIGKGAWVSVGDASLRADIGIIVKKYNTVSSMINDLQLQPGVTVETVGYHNIFDRGGARYYIEVGADADGMADHQLSNGLKATLLDYSLKTLGVSSGDDATQAINLMLIRNKTVLIEDHYLVNVDESSTAIKLRDNSVIKFSGGSLKLRKTTRTRYEIMSFADAKNVYVERPVLIGDKYEREDETVGEWGYGLYITACQNVTVIDPVLSGMFGDGFIVTTPLEDDGTKSPNATENITVTNAQISDCRRQGFTIAGGRNVNILGDMVIRNIKGAAPESAFDIEVDNNRPLIGLTVGNITAYNCNGYTYQIYSNTGNRIMEDINFGSLVSVNGRRGALNITAVGMSEAGQLKNVSLPYIKQVITENYQGNVSAYNGFNFQNVAGLKIGVLTSDIGTAVANTFRAQSATLTIDNLETENASSLCGQISNNSNVRIKSYTHNSKGSNSQLFISSTSKVTIDSHVIVGGKTNMLISGENTIVDIPSLSYNSAGNVRDVYIRINAGSTLKLKTTTFNVQFGGSVVENYGVLYMQNSSLGTDRTGATGVLCKSGSRTYAASCVMLDRPDSDNAAFLCEAGSEGYIVSAITSNTNGIRIQSGSSVKVVEHTGPWK